MHWTWSIQKHNFCGSLDEINPRPTALSVYFSIGVLFCYCFFVCFFAVVIVVLCFFFHFMGEVLLKLLICTNRHWGRKLKHKVWGLSWRVKIKEHRLILVSGFNMSPAGETTASATCWERYCAHAGIVTDGQLWFGSVFLAQDLERVTGTLCGFIIYVDFLSNQLCSVCGYRCNILC